MTECNHSDLALHICKDKGYEFQKFIAAGAFKETYKIRTSSSTAALKIFTLRNSIERTTREIDAMMRVRSSAIALLLDVGQVDFHGSTFSYFIEEYLEGGSLGDRIKARKITFKEAVEIGIDIGKALLETSQNSLVHRDIKPDNIMFRHNNSEAVLIDFGLVRNLNASSLTQTFQMQGPGTPLFSSPEQLNNNKELIDWRSDQFSLAVTLCFSLFGVHPFQGKTDYETVENIAHRKKCNSAVKNLALDAGLPYLLRMLEPFPIKRYRLPDEMIKDWQEVEIR